MLLFQSSYHVKWQVDNANNLHSAANICISMLSSSAPFTIMTYLCNGAINRPTIEFFYSNVVYLQILIYLHLIAKVSLLINKSMYWLGSSTLRLFKLLSGNSFYSTIFPKIIPWNL